MSNRDPQTRTALPQLADRYALGAALEVSPFCLGIVAHRDMVPLAFDAGINLFFVSVDLHWPLYEELRQGLKLLIERSRHVRDEIVVAAVSYACQPPFAGTNFRDLLRAFPELERLDVLVAGGAYENEFIARRERCLTSPFARGLGAHAFGASFHIRETALSAIERQLVDIAYVRYNPSHPGARRDFFPALPPEPSALLYNFRSVLPPLSAGQWRALGLDDDHWIPAPSDYYRYALTRPQVKGVLCSLNTPGELEALASALAEGGLEPEEERYMDDLASLAEGRMRVVAEAS